MVNAAKIKFSQKDLNNIPSPPNPENFWILYLNETMPITVSRIGGQLVPAITITVRKISEEEGAVAVQMTFNTLDPELSEVPRHHLLDSKLIKGGDPDGQEEKET